MARIRTKCCDRCQIPAAVLYRVSVVQPPQWQFLCDRCWPQSRANHPETYTYGGTWKARKRH